MNKQTFEIIDGVYVGPEVWEGHLDLSEYIDTLTSLGSLKEVGYSLLLWGNTNLVSLGSLTTVGGNLLLTYCTNLRSLGSLTKVENNMWLRECSNLVSLGPLKEVEGYLEIKSCTSLASLGSLTSVRGFLGLGENRGTLQDVQEKIRYYSSLPLHEALNALHTDEVQKVPLYKNILLKSLQGGGISSL